MNRTQVMDKIIILGFSSAYLPTIAEIIDRVFECRTFDVIKNIEVPEPSYPFHLKDYSFHHYMHDEYDFEANAEVPVYFGVLHSHIKYILYRFFNEKYGIDRERYLNWIDPLSSVSKSLVHKNGLGISAMTVIYSLCNLGFGVNLKRNSSLGENTTLGDFVTINPGVTLSGMVSVGEGTEISTGASCVHDITIGKHCLIGAGSVITKDIPDGMVAYGNPCRIIRENERWSNIKEL